MITNVGREDDGILGREEREDGVAQLAARSVAEAAIRFVQYPEACGATDVFRCLAKADNQCGESSDVVRTGTECGSQGTEVVSAAG